MHLRGPQTSDAAGHQRRKPNQHSRIAANWRAVGSSSMPRTSASAFDHDQPLWLPLTSQTRPLWQPARASADCWQRQADSGRTNPIIGPGRKLRYKQCCRRRRAERPQLAPAAYASQPVAAYLTSCWRARRQKRSRVGSEDFALPTGVRRRAFPLTRAQAERRRAEVQRRSSGLDLQQSHMGRCGIG